MTAERLINPVLGPNYWTSVPLDPEDRSLALELRDVVTAAIDVLPGGPVR